MLYKPATLLASPLLLAVGCSSSSDSGEITFEHVFDVSTETTAWSATGEADNELLCPEAAGVIQGFEDEDGAVQRPEEIVALGEVGEPFVNVSLELMTCSDGSGTFTFRIFDDVDPAIDEGETPRIAPIRVGTTVVLHGREVRGATTGLDDS